MAVTITNHESRSADTAHTAEPGLRRMDRAMVPGPRAHRGPGRRHEDRRGGRSDPGRLLVCGWLWRCRGCWSGRR
jgi:hypothetical protein